MPVEQERYLERVPLDDLAEHPDNPHEGNVDEIMGSLTRRGQYSPLIISADNLVLVGNHRLRAMRRLGWTTALVLRAVDPDSGQALAAADTRALEYLVVDNWMAKLGGDDQEKMIDVLTAIGDIDAAAVGLVQADLDVMVQQLTPPAWKPPPNPRQKRTPDHDRSVTVSYQCPSCGHRWGKDGEPPADDGGGEIDPPTDEPVRHLSIVHGPAFSDDTP